MPALISLIHQASTGGLHVFPVIVLFIGVCLSYVVYQRFLHPLAGVPGPFSASLSRLWMAKHSREGDMPWTMIALHDRYGPLVRTGPNEVSVSEPTAIKTIYGAGTKFQKSSWYSVWQGHRKFDLFPERDEKLHGRQRSLVSRAYSMGSLKDLEPYVDDTIETFKVNMDKRAGKVVNLGSWIQLFAFDVIGEVTFSRGFGFLDAGVDDGSFARLEKINESASWVGQMPWVYWLNDFVMPYIGNYLDINNRHTGLRTMAMKEVEGRKDRGSDRKDILSKLFAVHQEKPEAFNWEAVVSMATSNINAGSDTTAISIRAIIYYLLKNPAAKQRLVEEVDTFRRDGKLSDPVRLVEADSMPYLQAVMYEALRLHPAVGMSLPRVVPEGGFHINGVYLPPKTVIGTNAWVIHQNKEIFGDDAESFRPERWLKDDKGDMQRFFFAFGSGARTCLGRNISWMEMSKLVPTLLMHYDLDLAEPDEEWQQSCWWFVFQKGLNVVMRRRS